MIEFLKRLFAYYGAVVTVLVTLKKGLDLDNKLGWFWPCIVCITLLPIIAITAWIERRPKVRLHYWDSSDKEGSITLSISDGLKRVRLASPDDEAIAFEANKIVREGLDKGCINYQTYRTWRLKNRAIFTAIVDNENHLIGFFDIFPLREETASDIIAGKRPEHSLVIDDMLPESENAKAQYLYIATIMVNPSQTEFSMVVAKDIILLAFLRFVQAIFKPVEQRTFLAFGHTKAGVVLLRRSGFTIISLPKQNPQGDPLFILRPTDVKSAITRFERIHANASLRTNDGEIDGHLG